MKVLVVGSGGREHALTWKIAQSPLVEQVLCAPGNPGMAGLGRCVDVGVNEFEKLTALARDEGVGLVVVGPEDPLSRGLVDHLAANGIKAFGPVAAAARLEASKSFAKSVMNHCGIPTAKSAEFTDPAAAIGYARSAGAPLVIKADGLAAGKGVTVARELDTAIAAIRAAMEDRAFGDAGNRVLIEECLEGEEASFIVLCDGKNVLALATSQDHKRLKDGDEGPNTGGMGAYSPAPVVTADVHARAMREIILPTIRGMEKDGIPFTGFLYAGLMIDAQGRPKTLEFNCRMGDPETQPIMMRLKSDLSEVLAAAIDGKLDQIELQWDRRTALGVVMAAHGYPETPRKGDTITGPATTTYTFTAPDEAGTYYFRCDVHPEQMNGDFVVQ